MFEGKTGEEIKKTVGITTNKVDLLVGHMETISSRGGDVFPPFLGSFSVINPGTGEKLETKILGVMKEMTKAKTPIGT